jgi:ribosomal protein L30/L7E
LEEKMESENLFTLIKSIIKILEEIREELRQIRLKD